MTKTPSRPRLDEVDILLIVGALLLSGAVAVGVAIWIGVALLGILCLAGAGLAVYLQMPQSRGER